MNDREKNKAYDEHWSWIRMIVVQSLLGSAMGAFTGWLIIHHDIHRIGTMIEKSEHWFGFAVLLMFGFATLFGMVAGGAAIWFRAAWGEE